MKIDTILFEQVMLRLKPLLDGTARECKISLKGVSSDIVEQLWARLEKSFLLVYSDSEPNNI